MDEVRLRRLMKEYCRTQLSEAREELSRKTKKFKEYLEKYKNNGNIEHLREAVEYLHCAQSFPWRRVSDEDFKKLWDGFISEFLGLDPREILRDVDSHFKKWVGRIKGFNKAVISEMMSFYYPDLFSPWNGKVDRYFKELGLGKPKKYSDVLRGIENLKKMMEKECGRDLNLLEVDYFAWLVTEKLKKVSSPISTPSEGVNLMDYFTSKGYLYPKHLVSQLYVALKTKGFVIVSGLTGTGKTKIVQELAGLLGEHNFLFLPVRPDWRDSKPLLGYYNPITERYHETEFLQFVLSAINDYREKKEKALPYFVLLDEMNLAHVEYYFAEVLSVLESGRDESGFTREGLKLHDVEGLSEPPKEVKLPPNLYIVGTVNVDETTYTFSPKVLDRAFVVESHDVELESYPPQVLSSAPDALEGLRDVVLEDLRGERGRFLARSKDELNEVVREFKETEGGKYWTVLRDLNEVLEGYDLHFGYRVVDEMALFFKGAKESLEKEIVKFENDDEIFDLAVLMKILPKFQGVRKRIEDPLREILKVCMERAVEDVNEEFVRDTIRNWKERKDLFRFKHTAKKVLRMLRQLYEVGFASFS